MEHNNIYRSVFKVTHSGGSGSCFYLKNYDLFVTNYHVVEGYRTVAVHDNDRNPYLAKVVLVNPALDIALLAAEGDFSALPEMTLAADDSLTIGRKVYVAGYPYGKDENCDVWGEVISCAPFLKFRWRTESFDWHEVQTHLIGSYNIDNIFTTSTCFLEQFESVF